tara:strand:+ start:4434 stop:4880 length:447 start_codon:yes stop_codon:yes gene_type:complete
LIHKPHLTFGQGPLTRVFRIFGLAMWLVLIFQNSLGAQIDSMSRSERKAEERRQKEAAKAEEKMLKSFEKNYKSLQERHYKNQQTGREKNLIVPEGSNARTTRRSKNHEKSNVRKRMRRSQQKARRHRDGRTVSWWRRLSLRRSWKKH